MKNISRVPWVKIKETERTVQRIEDADGNAVCYGDISVDDANLIIAAPGLLESMKAFLHVETQFALMGQGRITEGWMKYARDAIAKAEKQNEAS